MTPKSPRGALLGLAALAIALLGIVSLELWTMIGAGAPADPLVRPPSAGTPLRPAAPQDRAPDWIATVLARPLFSPTRRPSSSAPAQAGADIGLPRLAGIIVTGSEKRAIFAARPGGKPLVISEGEAIGGFVVTAIKAGEVTLRGPDGARQLHPRFQAPNAGPATD